jgi:hypothetical protein
VKKADLLAILSMILIDPTGSHWSYASADANEPGCLRAIQGKAISDDAAKLLPKKCQAFRKVYLDGLDDLAHQPEKFESRLKDSIESAKGNESPYSSLVIAVLSQNPKQNEKLLPALEKRAAIETKLKLNYPYARVALEKIKTGKCGNFKAAIYDELCRGSDAVYARMVALNQSQAANHEEKKK